MTDRELLALLCGLLSLVVIFLLVATWQLGVLCDAAERLTGDGKKLVRIKYDAGN